jgi:predicted phage tail protein
VSARDGGACNSEQKAKFLFAQAGFLDTAARNPKVIISGKIERQRPCPMNAAQRKSCFAVAVLFIALGASFLHTVTTASLAAETQSIAVVGAAMLFSLGLALVYLGCSIPRKHETRRIRSTSRLPKAFPGGK